MEQSYLFDIKYHYLSGTHFKSFANISSSTFFTFIHLRTDSRASQRPHVTCDDISFPMTNAMCACDVCT